MSHSNTLTRASAEAGKRTPPPGEVFNPHFKACGFDAASVVGCQRSLGDGPKRLYTQLVKCAGRDAACFPSHGWLAAQLGKSERQVRYDLSELEKVGLIAHKRNGRRLANTYVFLWHEVFPGDRQHTATHSPGDRQDIAGGERQDAADQSIKRRRRDDLSSSTLKTEPGWAPEAKSAARSGEYDGGQCDPYPKPENRASRSGVGLAPITEVDFDGIFAARAMVD